jgi:putative Mg2+ transporter-C (MgtC) family protein
MRELVVAYGLQFHILSQLALAMLLAAVIGLDREMADKPAGLRTHMLVAGVAALLVSLGDVIVQQFDAEARHHLIRSDPLRLMEAVITGVSFLGAGTIIHRQTSPQVQGLTTAASLLYAAAVGMTVALSQWVLAVGVSALLLVVLRLMNVISRRLELRQVTSADDTTSPT